MPASLPPERRSHCSSRRRACRVSPTIVGGRWYEGLPIPWLSYSGTRRRNWRKSGFGRSRTVGEGRNRPIFNPPCLPITVPFCVTISEVRTRLISNPANQRHRLPLDGSEQRRGLLCGQGKSLELEPEGNELEMHSTSTKIPLFHCPGNVSLGAAPVNSVLYNFGFAQYYRAHALHGIVPPPYKYRSVVMVRGDYLAIFDHVQDGAAWRVQLGQ